MHPLPRTQRRWQSPSPALAWGLPKPPGELFWPRLAVGRAGPGVGIHVTQGSSCIGPALRGRKVAANRGHQASCWPTPPFRTRGRTGCPWTRHQRHIPLSPRGSDADRSPGATWSSTTLAGTSSVQGLVSSSCVLMSSPWAGVDNIPPQQLPVMGEGVGGKRFGVSGVHSPDSLGRWASTGRR